MFLKSYFVLEKVLLNYLDIVDNVFILNNLSEII